MRIGPAVLGICGAFLPVPITQPANYILGITECLVSILSVRGPLRPECRATDAKVPGAIQAPVVIVTRRPA